MIEKEATRRRGILEQAEKGRENGELAPVAVVETSSRRWSPVLSTDQSSSHRISGLSLQRDELAYKLGCGGSPDSTLPLLYHMRGVQHEPSSDAFASECWN